MPCSLPLLSPDTWHSVSIHMPQTAAPWPSLGPEVQVWRVDLGNEPMQAQEKEIFGLRVSPTANSPYGWKSEWCLVKHRPRTRAFAQF